MTYWSIWWRTFAWVAAVAGAIAFVVALCALIPGEVLLWVGLGALVLLVISAVAFGIWTDQGDY